MENAASSTNKITILTAGVIVAGIMTLFNCAGSDIVNRHVGVLRDGTVEEKIHAIHQLDKCNDKRAVPALCKALRDADEKVREEASGRLVFLHDACAFDPLIEALKDENTLVRCHAVYALEQMGDPRAAMAIIPLLNDADTNVRYEAAVTLGNLGSTDATDALLDALHDPVPEVRIEVVKALGGIGDPRALAPVIAFMRSEAWSRLGVWVRTEGLRAFRDKWKGPEAQAVLTEMLTDSVETPVGDDDDTKRILSVVARDAAFILARYYDDPAAGDILIEFLNRADLDKQEACIGLGHLAYEKAVPALTDMLENDRWIPNKRFAAEALMKIGGKEAEKAVATLLNGDDPVLRKKAAAFLGMELPLDTNAPGADGKDITATAHTGENPRPFVGPGTDTPPQFIILGVDDVRNIEGTLEMVRLVNDMAQEDAHVAFTMWVTSFLDRPGSRVSLERCRVNWQRLYNQGSEICNHTMNHNLHGVYWRNRKTKPEIVREIEGHRDWLRENIYGLWHLYSFKGGGGSRSTTPVHPEFADSLLAAQNFEYRGSRGEHPDTQSWPYKKDGQWIIDGGALDGDAPDMHRSIYQAIHSDYPGQFMASSLEESKAMWMANFEYHYNLPHRPPLVVNAFHDWGFKERDQENMKYQMPGLRAFLEEVLVAGKEKYPDTYVITMHQLIRYMQRPDMLETILAEGSGQDMEQEGARVSDVFHDE